MSRSTSVFTMVQSNAGGRAGRLGRQDHLGCEIARYPAIASACSKAAARTAIDAPPATIITPINQAEAFVAATGAVINHGGGRAFYRPSTDSSQLPPREAFGANEDGRHVLVG